MDYGALIVFGLALAALVAAVISVLGAAARGTLRRRSLVGVLLLTVFLGGWGYHVYRNIYLPEELVAACLAGDLEAARSLLRQGADPRSDFEGLTARQAAVESGNRALIRLLDQAGARNGERPVAE